MRLLSVGLTGTVDDVRVRLQQDCVSLAKEGFLVNIEQESIGRYTFLGCNVAEGELSFYNYERIKNLLKEYVAQVLAERVINSEEKKIIRKIILNNYDYFTAEEKDILYAKIVGLLGSNITCSKRCELNTRYDIVLLQIMEYLDNNYELVLDGFINFRLKDYKSYLEKIVDSVVNEFIMELEYKEFIRVLKYFVEIQQPKIEQVHIVLSANGPYRIFDKHGNALHEAILDEFSSTEYAEVDVALNYDDLLLTELIRLVPCNIIIHAHDMGSSPSIMETLRNIFEDRIAVCNGCELDND